MRRDPTGFRNRFAEWRKGKKASDIYKLGDLDYYKYMERLADKKATEWNDVPFKADPDIQLLRMLNDNTYNYKEFYNKNRYEANGMLYANPDAHFTDVGKTVYHPTFSEESSYSGKKSDYNPEGIVGGSWNENQFNVSPQQATSKYFSENKTRRYLKQNDRGVKLNLPHFKDGEEGTINFGPNGSSRNRPISELPLSGTDPVGKFVVESTGFTKAARIIGDALKMARLGRMAKVYKRAREYDQDVQLYTGKSLRRENILRADEAARNPLLSRPENPFYWMLDPIISGYSKLQGHPTIGPLLPF